ncbi:MAG: lipopolysaccharide biosynthesis protein [Calditerrivibrio sp.]|nr:lipopolysaccharide biosynthesis protein [Calditerrivibrio sp.]MCA1980914.1 lipopolysaccharide biosynthesis protein [Calditerrivibrio sp.]
MSGNKQFFNNVLTLFTGSILAQSVPLIVSPILTRQYSPESFGEYAFYLSIVTILSVAATGRYDLSIMIADDEETSRAATSLSFLLSIIFSSILFFLAILENIFGWFGTYHNLFYIGAINIGLIGSYNTLYHRLNRNGRFRMISVAAFIQSFTIAFFQLFLGIFHGSGTNLIIGNIFGQFLAVIFIVFKDREFIEIVGNLSFEKLKTVAVRFINFPKFDLWAGLFNIGFQQIPVLMLSYFFTKTAVGHFSLTQRMLQIPTSLIGGSILGAFRVKAIEEFKTNGNCVSIFVKIFLFMFAIGIVPSIIIFLFGHKIFMIIFGQEWIFSGFFSQIMIFMFFAKFITSPLTYMFYIAEKQSWNLIGQILFIISTVVSFYIGHLQKSIILALILYTISNTVLYIAYLLVSYLFAKGLYVNKK